MKATKRNNIKINFANTILAQASTQKNYTQKRLLDYSSIIEENLNSSYGQSKQVKKSKQVQEYYRILHDKIEQYQIYYMFLMENEAKKYDQYYQQIFKIIFDQFELGKIYIQKQIQRVHEAFQNKKDELKQLMSDLCLYASKDIKLQEKIERLSAHQVFQIDVVSINLIDLTHFKHDIKKYFMRQFDINCPNNSTQKDRNHSNQTSAQHDSGAYPSFSKNKQQQSSTQTCPEDDAIPTSQITQAKSQESQDDLLNCDEELGQKISESTRRRRKYQVGRQHVIKEEDESDQSNSIIQNYIQ